MASKFNLPNPWGMVEEQRIGLEGYAAEIRRLQAELDAERAKLIPEVERLRAELDEWKQSARNVMDADLVQCAALEQERELLGLRAQISACTPHLRERLDGTLESPADMLAVREREVLGLLGRLAAIEAQEPVDVQVRSSNPRATWQRPDVTKTEPTPLERAEYLCKNWPNRYSMRMLYARPVPAQAAPMSDERIDAIADIVIKGMPDGLRGFMRTWGYQQFARALLDVCAGHYRAGPTQAVLEPLTDEEDGDCDDDDPWLSGDYLMGCSG